MCVPDSGSPQLRFSWTCIKIPVIFNFEMSWKVDYSPDVREQIATQLKSGELTSSDIAALKRWVELIEERGLAIVQNQRWHDHPLEAEWTGFRAAAFSPAGRVIYSVVNNRLIVHVVRVTGTHDYRK